LFFELDPPRAILGDTNAELIHFYNVIRNIPERLYRRLCAIPRDAETYYRWRNDRHGLDDEKAALRFLYLNRNCFNGIFRTNLEGDFNVPYGHSQGTYFRQSDAILCARALKRATLIAGDFAKTLERVREGDFVYLDPPYAVQSRRVFREYGMSPFTQADCDRFAAALATIAKRGADFVVSYADSREARVLARPWRWMRFPVRRHVAGFATDRRSSYEIVITNMQLPAQLRRRPTRRA
jgi:DNA adenine methylase